MRSKQTFITHSPEETEALAQRLAPSLGNISVLALRGGLGAGKTTFVRGLARGLHAPDTVNSPTYTIVNEYFGDRPLYHFDMYRISSADDLYGVGWEDYLRSGGLCVIEWSELVEEALPPGHAVLELVPEGDLIRRITLSLETEDKPC